jgi:protein MpaA
VWCCHAGAFAADWRWRDTLTVQVAAPSQFEKQIAIDALVGAGLPMLGSSRQQRPIFGGWFSPTASRPPGVGDGGAPRTPRLLLVGGIHGDEPSSVEALLELVARARVASVSVPVPVPVPAPAATSEQGVPSAARVFILPALNPDGLLLGRKNAASDVDLNRNFPARNFTREHRAGYDPGPAPLSEPETRLLAGIIEEQAIDAVVAVHAPFACVNFDGPAGQWAQMVATACGWPARASIGYPTPGSLGSWLGVDRNVPVLTLELPPGPLEPFRAAAASALDAAIAGSRSAVNPLEIG